MKTINNIAIIGLGAIGAAFYDHVSRTLPDARLCVIARGERAARLRERGVTVNGKRLSVNVADTGEPSDLLVFAVKTDALAQAINDARAHIGKDTIIISCLNGITSERTIAAAYGNANILYSYCVKTDATRLGDEIIYRTMFTVPFGEKTNTPGQYSEAVLAVRDFFERAEIAYEIPGDMLKSMWWKYMLNIGVNQTLAVLRRPYSAIQLGGYARKIALDAMLEAVETANLEGVALTREDAFSAIAVVDEISPGGKPSTLQDIEAGRKTEIEMFSGDLLRTAEKHGVSLPVNAMLYRLIKALEER